MKQNSRFVITYATEDIIYETVSEIGSNATGVDGVNIIFLKTTLPFVIYYTYCQHHPHTFHFNFSF